jgi:hypothetical protein
VNKMADAIMKAISIPDHDGKRVFKGDIIVPALNLVTATLLIAVQDEADFDMRLRHTLTEIEGLSRRMRKAIPRQEVN